MLYTAHIASANIVWPSHNLLPCPKGTKPFGYPFFPLRKGRKCVATAAWQRCYGGMATLLRRRGNVVTGPWQRCYGPVATDEAASRNGNARVRNGFMPIRNGASDLCINYLHEKVLPAMLTWPRGHKKSTQTQQRCIHVRSFIRDRIRSGPLPYRIKRSSRYLGRFHISSSTMSSSLSMW